MKSPILGSSYVTRSVNAADNRCVNLFPEAIPEGGKEPGFLNRCPGLRLLGVVGTGPIRGIYTFNNDGYVVSGNEFYKVTPFPYLITLIGSVAGSGPVNMSDNGVQLFIACNGLSYIYNSQTNAFGAITDADFEGAVGVGYLDGYFVYNSPNGQKVWVTSLLDGTSIDPLDFASAEGSPDKLVTLVVDHREVWLFGTNSVEVWYNSGSTDFPLTRIQGAFNEIGCAAAYSVAKLDNGLFWLGSDARGRGIVYRANGYTGVRVSTHAVEWQIQQYGSLSDAIGYTYQQDGHAFYVLIFPNANTTWCYDVATQSWHERAGFADGQFVRHRSNCYGTFGNELVVGDYENGNIYAFDLNKYTDNGAPQKWLRSWRALPTGQNNLKRASHHSLQLDCESGVGLNELDPFDETDVSGDVLLTENGDFLITEDGNRIAITYAVTPMENPVVVLRWSDDGGHTWSNEHFSRMGSLGNYQTRVFWRRLGMTLKLRDRVYEVSGTDPVKISIMGAELLASPTDA